jgi:hypothetical protein
VKKQLFVLIAVGFLIAAGRAQAADSSARVTEAVNEVDHGLSQSTDTHPAPVGTVLLDGEYLKTGIKSRAELKLANATITRLGANTIFNYTVGDNQIDLQTGTILFSKPKDSKPMMIKTAAVTAAIVGTTGFVQKNGKSLLFGLIEGKAIVTIDGVNYTVNSGEILKFTPGFPPQIFAFNVPLLLATSPLITKFPPDLPNEKDIDHEVADYNDLVGRGFIQSPKTPFFLLTDKGYVPSVPIVGIDSAGQALDRFNTPPVKPQQDIPQNPNYP